MKRRLLSRDYRPDKPAFRRSRTADWYVIALLFAIGLLMLGLTGLAWTIAGVVHALGDIAHAVRGWVAR